MGSLTFLADAKQVRVDISLEAKLKRNIQKKLYRLNNYLLSYLVSLRIIIGVTVPDAAAVVVVMLCNWRRTWTSNTLSAEGIHFLRPSP